MQNYTKQSCQEDKSIYTSELDEYNNQKLKKEQRMLKKQASSLKRRKIRQAKERLWK